MFLAIDIGNTNITLGIFQKEIPSFVAKISADLVGTEDEYAAKISGILSMYGIGRADIQGAMISSVVPRLNGVIRKAVSFLYQIEPLIVGPGIKTGINIHCDTPSSVGADLITACVAVHTLYGSPCLIIDMGTVTKMTVMNAKGTFIGTSLMPGVQMGLTSLAEETAQLPQISLDVPRHVIAKNTVDCLRSGAVYGNACMLDGMIERMREESKENLSVYATGEYASLIIPHCKHEILLDETLILKGLYILYQKNQ